MAELVVYGNTGALPATMHYSGSNLVYEVAGFLLTLNAPNAASGEAHVGDGTFGPQTYNWHGGMENGAGTFIKPTWLRAVAPFSATSLQPIQPTCKGLLLAYVSPPSLEALL